MTIPDLIRLMENRLSYLNNARANAMASGDIEQVSFLDMQITAAHNTLEKLKSIG